MRIRAPSKGYLFATQIVVCVAARYAPLRLRVHLTGLRYYLPMLRHAVPELPHLNGCMNKTMIAVI